MVAGFNRGYQDFELTYRTCTPRSQSGNQPLHRGRLEYLTRPDGPLCQLTTRSSTALCRRMADGPIHDPNRVMIAAWLVVGSNGQL
nr:hypothetical protein [Bradyrhizobium zhanjiangense]